MNENQKSFLIVDAWLKPDKSEIHRCVVSSTWCRNDYELCYWPTHLALDKVSLYKLLRRHSTPDENQWEMFEIKKKSHLVTINVIESDSSFTSS